MTRTDVHHTLTTFLPDDQTRLHACEAASRDALDQAARPSELSDNRLVDAIEGSPEPARRGTG